MRLNRSAVQFHIRSYRTLLEFEENEPIRGAVEGVIFSLSHLLDVHDKAMPHEPMTLLEHLKREWAKTGSGPLES